MLLSICYGCAFSKRRTIRAGSACTFAGVLLLGAAVGGAEQTDHKKMITEEDAIRMVRIAGRGAINSYAGALTQDFAYFSPDGKQFVIILKKGNLERNTNDYSLLLFRSEEVFDAPKPKVLALMSSSSNHEAIKELVWLSDNDTILFLGENPGETTQLYSVHAKSGGLRKLTNHPTNLIRFASDAEGRRIAYAGEKPALELAAGPAQREGVVVSDEDLSDLLAGKWRDRNRDLFLLDTATGVSKPLPLGMELHGELYGDFLDFSLSPNGKQLVVNTNLVEVPAGWTAYHEKMLKGIVDRKLPHGAVAWVARYGVIDADSGKSRVLLDAPISYYGSEMVWPNEGQSVVLTGVFLPVDEAVRTGNGLAIPGVLEVELTGLKHTPISTEDLRFVRWDSGHKVMGFETRQRASSRVPPQPRYFRNEKGQWVAAETPGEDALPLMVVARQDLNTPPTIVVSDARTHREAVLLDPNPQFRELAFVKVEEIRFTGADFREARAGLYYPPDYVADKKYPLIVQTHGFDPKSFWMDGSFTTAFAAQTLASRGFLVLQVPDLHDWDGTPKEAPNMAETLERAVEFVDRLGCLDRNRIGLIGFSRTGLYVHYLLTHSNLRFAAAVIADGSDGGYTQYLQFLNAHPFTASDSELINGGMPFGAGLLFWLQRSPEFFLDRVNTPLMLQVTSTHNLPSMWAPYIGLKRMGRPVELLYFPGGSHILEKPWDRLASQGGSVEWFTFWLKNEVDPDPEKADKYERWRQLRSLSQRKPQAEAEN